jgi:hypothetical protein
LAATKLDEGGDISRQALRAALPELPAVGVSILDDSSLEALKDAIWKLTRTDPRLSAPEQGGARSAAGPGTGLDCR